MRDTKTFGKLAGLLVIAGAATTLAACGHDDNNGSGSTATVPPPPVVQSMDFEAYVNSTFMNAPNTTPVDPSSAVFTFDVNSDPTAFDALLM